MLAGIRKLLEKTNNPERSAYIWNAINAALAAVECPVILMVMTRTNGIVDAGIFSIAFAVATLMLHLAQYGLRRFQSSDINQKYKFSEYHATRLITCAAMIVASLAYCVYGLAFRDYGWEKFFVILLVCGLKCIQGYADVIHGHLQQVGRLDVATKASATRYIIEMLVYCVMLILTRNLLVSTIVCLVISLVVLCLTSINVGRRYCKGRRPSISGWKLKMILLEGFPLFASMFLNIYISNAPKYAIDAFLTDEIQAYFNIIFMPAFVVQLIAHFIFNPIITTYAELWLDENRKSLKQLAKLIRKQCYIVLGLTILGLLVAFTIGIPVLTILFHVDVSDYKMELCVIMAGGGMLAYATYFSTVITVIRLQKTLIFCYGIVALAAKLLAGVFVVKYNLMGAAIIYAILMTLLAIALFAITFWGIRHERKRLKQEEKKQKQKHASKE